MSILSTQLNATRPGPDGAPIPIPAKEVLALRGPVIQVNLKPSKAFTDALTKEGKSIPAPVPGFALIDTGASATCIDEDVAKKLGLPILNLIQMASASHSAHPSNVYAVELEMPQAGATISAPQAIGAALGPQNIIALIGRDVLASAILEYNGTIGLFTIAL